MTLEGEEWCWVFGFSQREKGRTWVFGSVDWGKGSSVRHGKREGSLVVWVEGELIVAIETPQIRPTKPTKSNPWSTMPYDLRGRRVVLGFGFDQREKGRTWVFGNVDWGKGSSARHGRREGSLAVWVEGELTGRKKKAACDEVWEKGREIVRGIGWGRTKKEKERGSVWWEKEKEHAYGG